MSLAVPEMNIPGPGALFTGDDADMHTDQIELSITREPEPPIIDLAPLEQLTVHALLKSAGEYLIAKITSAFKE